MTLRRPISTKMIAALCCVAALSLGQAVAEIGHGSSGRRESSDVSRVLFPLPGGGRLLPQRVSAVGPGGALAAALPDRAAVLEVNRLNLSPVPVVGQAFGGEPIAARLRPRFRVGSVHGAGGDLILRLDAGLDPARAAELLSRPLALLTRQPGHRRPIVLALPRLAAAEAGGMGDGMGDGPEIGGVYDAGQWLLLSPPRSEFYGLDPLFD